MPGIIPFIAQGRALGWLFNPPQKFESRHDAPPCSKCCDGVVEIEM
jgi:hypothetical protein